ncbi:MAG: ATP-binding cassette domain-containing protein [Actinomycetota bacterium]|nr:ATP-binding cassette domain-containing protein [Actinomycetota bacterium]
MGPAPLRLDRVCLRRAGTTILDDVSLRVEAGQRWLVLGANGSGKTSLLRIAALYDHPTSGVVEVLGERLGRTDVRTLRRRISYVSAALADQIRPELSALDVVRTARFAALEPWWHRYAAADDDRARWCLDQLGVGSFAERALGSLSSGERQRVLLARSLMNEPAIILLDEPAARLDLGGREQLMTALVAMAAAGPPLVLVTHHVDDVPPTMTHALVLRGGRALAAGPIEEAMTSTTLSACFGLPLHLERRRDGRFSAWAAEAPPP